MNSKPETRNSYQKVVVIAASAGGIDALVQLFSRLPDDVPAAFLVVQHLKGDRPTHLHEYLARYCSQHVCLAEDGLPPENNVVYLAVPGQHLRLDKERLILDTGEAVQYVRPSADVLFASAAQAFGSHVIGVVLSGTGRDGARGCLEIKAHGGITLAQDEKSAGYFAMPKAAIDKDAIDYVLPASRIAEKIVALISREVSE